MKTLARALLLLSLLLAACARQPSQCGMKYNAERQRLGLGLPVIPANWRADLVHSTECTWFNPEYKAKYEKHIPVHWSKYVSFHGDTPIMDQDVYFGPQDFVTPDGTHREDLAITYYYQTSSTNARWEVSLWTADAILGSGETLISLEEANRVLHDWGIDRLTE